MLRQELFGISIHAVRMGQAIAHLRHRIGESRFDCRYVVTPNVDHAVLLQSNSELREAYGQADLVLADGFPLVWASRWLGRPLPERVPGSDLVPQLFDSVGAGETLRIFLLGAAPGVATRAAKRISRRWPAVQIVGAYSPPMGFESDRAENDRILARINEVRPDVLVIGLGAPKQECWIYRHRSNVAAKVALCVGATIDFMAGERKRAPRWMQRIGLEWLFRMCGEPRRLVKRYAFDAWVFPRLVWKQWRDQRGKNRLPSAGR